MVDRMIKYSFILMNGDKEDFLSKLQELGVVDITRSSKPIDETSGAMLDRIASLKREIEQIESCSDVRMRELDERVAALEQEAKAASAWGEFDASVLADLKAKGVDVHFYCVPDKAFDPEWENSQALEVISREEGSTWFVVLNPVDFPVKELAAPSRSVSEVLSQKAETEKERESYRAELSGRASEIPSLKEKIAGLTAELDRYLAGVRGESAAEGSLCCFVGFAPTECGDAVAAALASEPVYYVAEEATAEDNPPIKLHNNRFNRLFESITGMYGMPVYDEFDPTPYLAIFFMLFFAMCMGDAGYGLVLILFGLAQKKGWVNIGMFKGLGPLIMVLGVITTIVGVPLGSFFGIDLLTASWVPEGLKKLVIGGTVAGYDAKMVLALGVGVFHLCLAMTLKAVWQIRRFGFKENLGTLGWTLLIVGTVLVAALAMLKFVPMTAAKWLIIGIAGVSALGIFFFNKLGRNPLLNFGVGLWDTYQMATGILGDVLSYIRLYALGLAGGMLGAAFNNLALMVRGDSPTWQWLPFVLILLVGHVLNLLMSCLGAFVHPLRLNFVEFFKNSGYEGKGLKYNPLKKQ